ncbi:hypothetical protein TRFO_11577 [Tritrichomonas foetus]|uniref:PH domain-containing protein n=1 Tax=Tritrichomonas foetus TaxID=1144522 RepID=A0A1J4J2U5_9EUKA|nr:hypothetical protein TRFO_11577 [Tritrichomonas foetus]|eukprot:OHS93776.1 hypothetical protein TRFO_11577 [Tritrichomonas foetus]
MEGNLLKKGWFDSWKPRYVRCDDRYIKVFQTKESPLAKTSLLLNGCVVKEIPQSQYNKQFVFSVKADDTKLTLAADTEAQMNTWITYFKRFAKRPSILTTNINRQSSISAASRRSIICSVHSEKPALLFDSNQMAGAFENEFGFSEICLEFLQLLQDHFDNSPNTPIPGIEIKKINAAERKTMKANMKASLSIMKCHIDNIFVPLQCICDDKTGHSFAAKVEFYLPKHRPLSKISKSKITLLGLALGITQEQLDKINFFEDNRGRLWVMNASELEYESKECKLYAKRLDSGALFVYDAPSLNMSMRTHGISMSSLPDIFSKCETQEMKEICMIEMISRSCKQLFRDFIVKDSVAAFFNQVLGTSKKSKDFWENKLIPAIQNKYRIKAKNIVNKQRLLCSLQYHLNVLFNPAKTYNFNNDKPFSSKDVKQFCSTIHHNFIQLSNVVFNKKQDPADLLNKEFYKKAAKVLNERISLLQNLYGDDNDLLYNDILMLLFAHLSSDDTSMAEICYSSISASSNSVALPLSSLFLISKAEDMTSIKQLAEGALSRIYSMVGNNSFIEIEFLKRVAKYSPEYGQIAATKAKQSFGENHPFSLYVSEGSVEDMKKNISAIQDGFGKNSGQLAHYYYSIAERLIDNHQWRESLSFALQSYKIRRATKSERIVYESIQQIAFLYDEMNEEKNAITFYTSLYSYLKQNDDSGMAQLVVLQNILRMYFHLMNREGNDLTSGLSGTGSSMQLKSIVSELESHDPLTYADELFNGNDEKLSCILKFIQLNPESFSAEFGLH